MCHEETKIITENFCKNVLQYHPIPVFFLDVEGNLVWSNEPFYKLFHINKKESFLQFFNKEPVYFYFNQALNGFANIFQIEMEHSDSPISLSICFTPMMGDGEVVGIYGIASNDSDDRLIQEKFVKFACEDHLTQLPNRFQFFQLLDETIRESKSSQHKLAVLMFDINRFRLINENLGYFFGDQALKLITERMMKYKRENDILARMGGDEFILLLKEIKSVEEVKEKVEHILYEMTQPYEIEGFEFTLTTSVGISIFPDHGLDTQTLIKTADTALSKAKTNGTNHYEIYTSEMARGIYEWFQVEKFLHRALERKEFKLYFQPQFCTKTKTICGVEVLVRWQHPENGLISPGSFIEIAEETGLIAPIGEWVLLKSCQQMKRWLDLGHRELSVSVNVSLKQFTQRNFAETVTNVLKKTKLPANHLTLEVTESTMIDLERTLETMKKLKRLGVKISLDDFGTGYSSLQYLSELPIDELKIDKSFVNGICHNERSKAIISMIIQLGHLLNLSVIAEGVENEQQYIHLTNLGCDKVQGYYFSKPLMAEEYEELYVRKKT